MDRADADAVCRRAWDLMTGLGTDERAVKAALGRHKLHDWLAAGLGHACRLADPGDGKVTVEERMQLSSWVYLAVGGVWEAVYCPQPVRDHLEAVYFKPR
jgi:hypothetical protein